MPQKEKQTEEKKTRATKACSWEKNQTSRIITHGRVSGSRVTAAGFKS
jgi:hypothetical protein